MRGADTAEEVLRGVALFAAADPAQLRRAAEAATPRRLARGQVLFTEGEVSDQLYVVVSGRLKVVLRSERGEALVLALVGPGDALGELGVVDGMPRSAGAEALEAAELLCVPGAVVHALLAASPAASLALLEDITTRFRSLAGAAADLVFLDLPHRLAKLLATLDGDALDLPQVELAARLGVARPSLNRSLLGLQRRGWVEVTRGRVRVLDRAALGRYAGP